MTVNSSTNRESYSGNGVTVLFAFSYPVFEKTDLTVILVSSAGVPTTLVLDTNYSVTLAGDSSSADVTMVVPPATGETLVVIREVALTQGLNLVENDPMPSESLEIALDRNVMMAQQNSTNNERTVRLNDGDTSSFDTTLPITHTADTALVVNATGDGFAEGPSTTEISNAEGYAVAAEASATSASGSAASASQSAATAQQAAASIAWNEVRRVSAGDNPITAESGVYYACDTSAGNVLITLPLIAVVGEPANIAAQKSTGDVFEVIISPSGTDTINDVAGDLTLSAVSSVSFYADEDTAPDNWQAVVSGASSANAIKDLYQDGVDFTAGVTNTLTLSEATVENSLDITFDGITQYGYTLLGLVVTFSAPIPVGVNEVEAQYYSVAEIGVPSDSSVTAAKLASGAATLDKLDRTGDAGQVLTAQGAGVAPTWEEAVASEVLLETIVASADSTIDFTNHIDGTYDVYEIRIEDARPFGQSQLLMLTSSDGGLSYDTGAGNYKYFRTSNSPGSTAGGGSNTQDSFVEMTAVDGLQNAETTYEGFYGNLRLYRVSDSSRRTRFSSNISYTDTSTQPRGDILEGFRNQTGVVDAVRFYLESSHTFVSGTFTLWGIN